MAADEGKDGAAGSITIMMCGLPGNMGKEVSAACLRRGFNVADVALTGKGMPEDVTVDDGSGGRSTAVKLVSGADAEPAMRACMDAEKAAGRTLIAIDFTHPTAVNPNSELYAKLGLPFVMGTTGGDREALMKVTTDAGIYAVIAANMCKQIVALQTMLEMMSTQFPGAFSGYSLSVVESHQSGKADTSGTAKDMVKYFNALKGGQAFDVESIDKIREPAKQLEFGVPEGALSGHAWHTYRLESDDKSVAFEFKHNVCGRVTYAEGVADAVTFLAAQITAGSEKKIFNMIDILRAGAMN